MFLGTRCYKHIAPKRGCAEGPDSKAWKALFRKGGQAQLFVPSGTFENSPHFLTVGKPRIWFQQAPTEAKEIAGKPFFRPWRDLNAAASNPSINRWAICYHPGGRTPNNAEPGPIDISPWWAHTNDAEPGPIEIA